MLWVFFGGKGFFSACCDYAGWPGVGLGGEVTLEGETCTMWEHDVVCMSKVRGSGLGGGEKSDHG